MTPQTETFFRPGDWRIETELFSVHFNSRLAFFWCLRRILKAFRFGTKSLGLALSIVFGKYELVQQVAPGQSIPVRPSDHLLEADQNLRRGISG